MKQFLLYLIILCTSIQAHAGGGERQNYIDTWKEAAITQMEKYGIPASITLAQGILESGNGKSMLTREANNHFGIKCHGWDGPGVYHDDDKKGECFRKYRSAEDSFEDHSQFLLKKRYAALFELKPTDYKGWAKGLKKAGYATDPKYANLLIRLIEDNKLDQYDNGLIVERREFESSRPKQKKHTIRSESTEVIDLTASRTVLMHPNKIKFVKAKKGDNVDAIASQLDLAPWQIKKYNDPPDKSLSAGTKVHLRKPPS